MYIRACIFPSAFGPNMTQRPHVLDPVNIKFCFFFAPHGVLAFTQILKYYIKIFFMLITEYYLVSQFWCLRQRSQASHPHSDPAPGASKNLDLILPAERSDHPSGETGFAHSRLQKHAEGAGGRFQHRIPPLISNRFILCRTSCKMTMRGLCSRISGRQQESSTPSTGPF